MKKCKVCNVEKVPEGFRNVSARGKTYRRNECRECENARLRGDPAFDIDVIPPEPPTAPMPSRVLVDTLYDFGGPEPRAEEARRCQATFRGEPPRDLQRVLIIPDVHRPYHDKAAWALLLRAAREFKPDKIVVLGDFADFYSVSSFDKHPKKASDLKWEADDANLGLDELDKLGAGTKIFIKGNHEDRLERYLCKAAPALIGCVSVDELFRFAERGWQVVDYKRSTRLGKLRVTHDTGTAGINAHRQSVDAFQASVVIGHTHRMEMSFKGCADGSPTVGAMFGWLGDFAQIDYMQAVKARRDWVHGFGIGYQELDGVIHLQPVPIINGRCVVGGKLIR